MPINAPPTIRFYVDMAWMALAELFIILLPVHLARLGPIVSWNQTQTAPPVTQSGTDLIFFLHPLLSCHLLIISMSSLGEVDKINTRVGLADKWAMRFIAFTYYAPVGLEAAIFGKRCPILQSWMSEGH